MKIRLLSNGHYGGLADTLFPVEIECEIDLVGGYGIDVPFDVIAKLPNFEYFEDDTQWGEPYYFYRAEFEVLS